MCRTLLDGGLRGSLIQICRHITGTYHALLLGDGGGCLSAVASATTDGPCGVQRRQGVRKGTGKHLEASSGISPPSASRPAIGRLSVPMRPSPAHDDSHGSRSEAHQHLLVLSPQV